MGVPGARLAFVPSSRHLDTFAYGLCSSCLAYYNKRYTRDAHREQIHLTRILLHSLWIPLLATPLISLALLSPSISSFISSLLLSTLLFVIEILVFVPYCILRIFEAIWRWVEDGAGKPEPQVTPRGQRHRWRPRVRPGTVGDPVEEICQGLRHTRH